MTQIPYCGSVRMQFCVSRDLFTNHTAVEATVRTFFTAVTYGRQSNTKLYLQKNSYVQNPSVELAQ